VQVYPQTPISFWSGAALVAIGLIFAGWARAHLAGNWSGTVTLKQDHSLTRSGPYRLARHPIYTGLLLAILGSALLRPSGAASLRWRCSPCPSCARSPSRNASSSPNSAMPMGAIVPRYRR